MQNEKMPTDAYQIVDAERKEVWGVITFWQVLNSLAPVTSKHVNT